MYIVASSCFPLSIYGATALGGNIATFILLPNVCLRLLERQHHVQSASSAASVACTHTVACAMAHMCKALSAMDMQSVQLCLRQSRLSDAVGGLFCVALGPSVWAAPLWSMASSWELAGMGLWEGTGSDCKGGPAGGFGARTHVVCGPGRQMHE